MILGPVFSKNRALRLDACLSSFAGQVTDAEDVRMVILYTDSTPSFLRPYGELASENAKRAEFVLEPHVYANRSNESLEWSAERFAHKFDEGCRVDIGALDGFVPAACHRESEPRFVKQEIPNARG